VISTVNDDCVRDDIDGHSLSRNARSWRVMSGNAKVGCARPAIAIAAVPCLLHLIDRILMASVDDIGRTCGLSSPCVGTGAPTVSVYTWVSRAAGCALCRRGARCAVVRQKRLDPIQRLARMALHMLRPRNALGSSHRMHGRMASAPGHGMWKCLAAACSYDAH
jgi:hypothetical protein